MRPSLMLRPISTEKQKREKGRRVFQGWSVAKSGNMTNSSIDDGDWYYLLSVVLALPTGMVYLYEELEWLLARSVSVRWQISAAKGR